MNQRDSLNRAIASVYAAQNVATAMHNLLAAAINATPSSGTRNALTTANIQLAQIETILHHTTSEIIDMLRKEEDDNARRIG